MVTEVRRRAPHPKPTAPKSPATKAKWSVPHENILQLLPDAVVPSREELAGYWETVADDALADLGRPVKGTTFYHMGSLPPIAGAVRPGPPPKAAYQCRLCAFRSEADGVVEIHPRGWGRSGAGLGDTLDAAPQAGLAQGRTNDTKPAFILRAVGEGNVSQGWCARSLAITGPCLC